MDNTTVGPQLVTQINVDAPLPTLPARTPMGHVYHRALAVVRLHGMPVDVVEIEVNPGVETPPALLAALMWARIRSRVNEHLREDGLGEISSLDPWSGIVYRENGHGPRCRRFGTGGLEPDDVTVVVPTIGESPVLEALVRSVLRGSMRPHEVVIAYNRPVDRWVSRMVGEVFPDEPVRVVHAPDGGASHARNSGARAASTPVVAFLDDDVEVDPHWLEGVLRGFGREPGVSGVTGLILPASLEDAGQVRMQQFGGFDKGGRPALFDLDRHAHDHPLYPYLPGIYGSGANMALRREVFTRLGGFDERLGPGTRTRGGEDIDLLLRAVLAGELLAYEPQSLVHHHHRAAPDRELRSTMYAYGAGLGAVLVKQATHRPARREIVRRVPGGLRYLLSASSPKNARHRSGGYPASLRIAELAGLASAPVTYMRSRQVRQEV